MLERRSNLSSSKAGVGARSAFAGGCARSVDVCLAQQLGGVARAGDARRFGGQPEAFEHEANRGRVGHLAERAESRVASGASRAVGALGTTSRLHGARGASTRQRAMPRRDASAQDRAKPTRVIARCTAQVGACPGRSGAGQATPDGPLRVGPSRLWSGETPPEYVDLVAP
jgi:hypothetical protein